MCAPDEFRHTQFGGITDRMSLADFRESLTDVPPDVLRRTVDGAVRALTGLYVHLPLKRAAYAVDPLQQLRRLRSRIPQAGSDEYFRFASLGFHQEMLAIFNGLHDLHTQYVLPEQFRSRLAFLPFIVEEYWDDPQATGPSTIVISKIADDDGSPADLLALMRDAEIERIELRYWNGIPARRWLEREATRNAGANAAASWARALDTMTVRWLGIVPVPDEDWIDLRVAPIRRDQGQAPAEELAIHAEWSVGHLTEELYKAECPAPGQALRIGADVTGEQQRRLRERTRWITQGGAGAETGDDGAATNEARPWFRWSRPADDVGYIRVFTFSTEDPRGFLDTFMRIVKDELGTPAGGLIVDIRGNPGGNVVAGELLLESLSPGAITPAPLQFLNTQAALDFANADKQSEVPQLRSYASSIEDGLMTGAQYSRGLPAQPAESYNQFGQLYDGPVVLLVDGRSYSTSDLVAAGFQDNGIGPVVGTADRTGAGGAITVRYDCLRELLTVARNGQSVAPSAWPALPADGGLLQFALQRFTRVRAQATEILEERGVTVDPGLRRRPTHDDLLHGNRDLIAFAVDCLRSRAAGRGSLRVRPALGLTTASFPTAARTLRLNTERVANVQVWGPTGWVTTAPVQANTVTIPLEGFTGDWVRLDGYNEEGVLVVSRRVPVESA